MNSNTNNIKRRVIYLLFFFVFSTNISAQKYNLEIVNNKTEKISFFKKNYKKIYTDSIYIYPELYKYLNYLFSKGYLSASFDSVYFSDTEVKAYLYLGEKYIISNIFFDDKDKEIIRKLKIKKKNVKNITLNPLILENIYNKIIKYYENNGYPFVTLKNDSVKFVENKIEIKLKISKNIKVKIKNIHIKGEYKISEIFIKKYLSLSENELYNQSIISEISPKIDEIDFVNEIKIPEVEFYGKNADVYLYIKTKKANQFNGIIGFIPDREDENKLSFTGDISVKLLNTFNKGESLSLKWNKPDKYSQRLKLNFNYPYLFGSSFGTLLDFGLDKKDTTYLTLDFKPELKYYFRNNDKISLFLKYKNSMILSSKYIDTTIYSDAESTLVGFGFDSERLDYKYNPAKGYSFYTDISTGKRISNGESKSDSRVKLFAEYYSRIYKNLVLKLAVKNEYIFSEGEMFMNEMIRIGGFNSIRGFDQDEIYTSAYSIGSVELRYLFEKKSNFYIFFDIAKYMKNNINENIFKNIFGYGAGLNFETKAGIFSLSYALGKQQNNNIQLSNSKIHIGYVNVF